MRFTYSRNAKYPELVVPTVLTSGEGQRILDADAKIDTGADVTIIPETIRKILNLQPAGQVTGVGARGERWHAIPTYFIRIRPANLDWFEIEVVTSPHDYLLLGRDVLNQCILLANGPAGFFQLDLPSSAISTAN